MEVWKYVDGIFLGQGKYAVDILKKFGILDRKAIASPIALTLNLMCDASSQSMDATMYR